MLTFKKGEEILTSTPFVYVVGKEGHGRFCDYCLKECDSLKQCTACKYAYFCNKQCQRSAWPDHKAECAGLCKVAPRVPDASVRLFSRLLVKLRSKSALSEAEIVFGRERRFSDLMSHVESISKDPTRRLKDFPNLWVTTTVFLDEDYLPSPEEGFVIYGKMVINSYCIYSHEVSVVGTGLYLGASIFDHSCAPNAHAVFDGYTMRLRASEDICCSSVDGIRITYIDLMSPKSGRQELLRKQYYFDCQCARCGGEVPDCITEKSPELTAEVESKTKELASKGQDEAAARQMRRWAEKFLAGNKLPETDVAHVNALDLLAKSCTTLGDYHAALAHYLAREPVFRLCYGPYHPVYTVLLFSIAKLYHCTVQLDKAMEYFEKAEAGLAVSHGSSNALYKDMMEARAHCKMEIENAGKGVGVLVSRQS